MNILFDFDGTLVDTAPGIVNTLRASLIRMNKPVPDDEVMKNTIGLPLWQAFKVLGCETEEEYTKAVEIYRQLFYEHELPYITIFEGVKETLAELKKRDVRMAIVTSRDCSSLNMITANNDIDQYFETRIGNRPDLRPKPAPDLVLALFEEMNIKAEDTLVVGDTTFDILMGNNAGCRTCAVTYGNHTKERLQEASPTFMIDNIADLLSL